MIRVCSQSIAAFLPKAPRGLLIRTHSEKFSTMRKVGKYYVPDLPAYKINPQALKQVTKDQQQMSINKFLDLTGTYPKYRDLQQCRYFAFEYRNRIYHVFNAYVYPMGRMINEIATIIRGRNTPHFKNSQLNVKNGEICIIVNAEDPLFTGKKLLFKNLKYHTGFIGHLKTFSYRSVLNKKPQLLYYYLLRKAMPKTKLSQHYLKNLKIFRGPTHNIPNIPQFAPMKFIQNPLTQIDLKQYIQSKKDQAKVIFQGQEGSKGTVRGKILEHQLKEDPRTLDTGDNHYDSDRKTRFVNKYSNRRMMAFVNIQRNIRRRYKTVRAPYSKKPKIDAGFQMFFSEKQAKKRSDYEQLANQEIQQMDEQVIQDPLKRKGFDK